MPQTHYFSLLKYENSCCLELTYEGMSLIYFQAPSFFLHSFFSPWNLKLFGSVFFLPSPSWHMEAEKDGWTWQDTQARPGNVRKSGANTEILQMDMTCCCFLLLSNISIFLPCFFSHNSYNAYSNASHCGLSSLDLKTAIGLCVQRTNHQRLINNY